MEARGRSRAAGLAAIVVEGEREEARGGQRRREEPRAEQARRVRSRGCARVSRRRAKVAAMLREEGEEVAR